MASVFLTSTAHKELVVGSRTMFAKDGMPELHQEERETQNKCLPGFTWNSYRDECCSNYFSNYLEGLGKLGTSSDPKERSPFKRRVTLFKTLPAASEGKNYFNTRWTVSIACQYGTDEEDHLAETVLASYSMPYIESV